MSFHTAEPTGFCQPYTIIKMTLDLGRSLPLIVVAGSSPTGIGEESVSDRPHRASDRPARMLRKMTPSEQDPPAVAAADPPRAGGQVVAVAVALLEAAALIAAMRRVASWNPLLPLYAAADRMWTPSASEDQQDWRTDPSTQAADVRLAVLVAEATIGRCLAEGGYLSARELSVDLRQAAAWLAAGAQFGG